jgi:hypothetical protein
MRRAAAPISDPGVAVARRMVCFVLAAALAFASAVPSAFAWGNGGDDGNGYGTHDWVLDEAIGLAGPDASWVDVPTALRATDDPDNGPSRFTHVFRDMGLYGGAPEKVSEYYYQAVTAYAAGDRMEASRCLGLLSHYYADVLNPFHSSYDARSWVSYHLPYEYAVGPYTRRLTHTESWITPDVRIPLTDVRARTVAAACFSRARFAALIGALRPMTQIVIGQPVVYEVTGQVLSRAANDLADIVQGIPSGSGLAQPPVTMKVTVSRRYPVRGGRIGVYATCTDAAGRPIDGEAVVFTWPLASGGSTEVVAYTGPTGVARNWQTLGRLPLLVRSAVRAVADSSGSAVSKGTWFVPSVALGYGTAGLRATVSDATPRRESTVTAKAVVHDSTGRAVAGLPVTFAWRFRTATFTYAATTDSAGVARVSRNIGRSTRGYRVSVTVKTFSSGSARTAATSFVPH